MARGRSDYGRGQHGHVVPHIGNFAQTTTGERVRIVNSRVEAGNRPHESRVLTGDDGREWRPSSHDPHLLEPLK